MWYNCHIWSLESGNESSTVRSFNYCHKVNSISLIEAVTQHTELISWIQCLAIHSRHHAVVCCRSVMIHKACRNVLCMMECYAYSIQCSKRGCLFSCHHHLLWQWLMGERRSPYGFVECLMSLMLYNNVVVFSYCSVDSLQPIFASCIFLPANAHWDQKYPKHTHNILWSTYLYVLWLSFWW